MSVDEHPLVQTVPAGTDTLKTLSVPHSGSLFWNLIVCLLHLTYARSDTCCYSDKSSLNDLMVARSPLFRFSWSFLCFAPLPELPGLLCTWKGWKGHLRNLYLGTQRIISIVPGALEQHNSQPETFQLSRWSVALANTSTLSVGKETITSLLQHERQEANRQKL